MNMMIEAALDATTQLVVVGGGIVLGLVCVRVADWLIGRRDRRHP